jgi:alkylhydroperoxidase family enzyme
MSRVTAVAEATSELEGAWGHRPAYFNIFMEDYLASLERSDPVLVELARIRLAQLVESDFDQTIRYEPARQAGLTEERIAAIHDYPTSALFNERERAVLEFTEQFAMQSSSITDEDCARVQEHLSPTEFIYLTKALGTADQFSRANSAFRLGPARTVPANMPSFTVAPTKTH